MIEALKLALADVSRLPIERQQDVVSVIMGIIAMEQEVVEWHVFTRLKLDAEPPYEEPDGYHDSLPEHMKARSVRRDPFAKEPRLSDELADAIKLLETVDVFRQLNAATWLSDMIEGDRVDFFLTPAAEARLQEALKEDPSTFIASDEMWDRLGVPKSERGPRALTVAERKVLDDGLERARRGINKVA